MTGSAFTICCGVCHGAVQPACYRCWLTRCYAARDGPWHSRIDGPRVTGGVVFACWQMGTPCGGDVGLSVPGGRRARPVRTIMCHDSCDREPAGRPRVAWRDGNKLRARGRRVTSLTLFVCMRAVASDQTSPLRVVTLFGARRPRRAEAGRADRGGPGRDRGGPGRRARPVW